jgi:hypothetical protein
VCSAVLENLIRFCYGCGSRGASLVISRLGGYIDGLILVVPCVTVADGSCLIVGTRRFSTI